MKIGVKFLSDVQKAYLTCCQTALSDYNAKKERFLNGERTDGLYSQKVINEMFEDVNQKLDQGGPIGSESDRKSDPIGIGSVIGRTRQRKFGLVRSVKSDPIGKIGCDYPIGK